MGRFSAILGVCACLCGSLGCRHRAVQQVVLPAQTPVALEPSPSLPSLSMETTPGASLPAVPVATDEPKPKKSHRRTRPTQTAAAPITNPGPSATTAPATATVGAVRADGSAGQPPEAANNPPLSATEIGVFTVGGEQNPHSRRDAADLIANNDKRLGSLSSETVRQQAPLVSKVRTFQRDAEQALGSGDTEGAKTLATKGKLLLDDLDRGVPSQ